MKTKAVRLYGKSDLRLEEFDLPEIKEDEILVKVYSDSMCMSTYKEVKQGANHIRVPDAVHSNPIIVGHEFAGTIVEVGKKWQDKYHVGKKFALLPGIPDQLGAPGYSYEYFGGNCTYCIIPNHAIEKNCFYEVDFDSYYEISAVEPLYCVIGGFNSMLHSVSQSYEIATSNVPDGNLLILGGCGPMGIMAINYACEKDNGPKRVVVTDIDSTKLKSVQEKFENDPTFDNGTELIFVNTAKEKDSFKALMDLTNGEGYDDVFVYAPVREVCELGDSLLAFNGCLNLFAGPEDKNFSAEMNLYNSHYKNTKIMGSSGGFVQDFVEALDYVKQKKVNPARMISHIGGIDAIIHSALNLPKIPGGKKLFYTQIDLPLTAIEDFEELGKSEPLFKDLHAACKQNHGLWNPEAEKILLEHYKK